MVLLGRHRDRGGLRIGIAQLILALVGLAFLVFLAVNYLMNFIG